MNPRHRFSVVRPTAAPRPAALLAAAMLLLAAAAPRPAGAAASVKVVASLPNLGAIAHEIGGERLDLTVIASGVQDAHFVDPKPSYIVKLRAADLLLVNGLDLEIGWIPPLAQGARNAKVVPGGPGYIDASAGIAVVEIPTGLSRAEGDVHPYGNPHYLGDPVLAITVAQTIADALKKADPAGASVYEDRRKAFVARLDQALFGSALVDLAGGAKLEREAAAGTLDRFLDTPMGGAPLKTKLGGWLGKLAPDRGRPIVTYHKDATYFASRFGLVVVDYVEPKPGIQPSARHLEELTARLQHGDARVVVTRPYNEHRSTDLLAQKTGVTIVTLPLEVGGDPKATDYFALFDLVTERLAAALQQTAGAAAATGSGSR
jgi:zinc/manganese transport system substrate-binding protein